MLYKGIRYFPTGQVTARGMSESPSELIAVPYTRDFGQLRQKDVSGRGEGAEVVQLVQQKKVSSCHRTGTR